MNKNRVRNGGVAFAIALSAIAVSATNTVGFTGFVPDKVYALTPEQYLEEGIYREQEFEKIYAENSKKYLGDVNADSVVDMSDLTVCSLYLLGETSRLADKTNLWAMDTNIDGTENVADLAELMQYVSGVSTTTAVAEDYNKYTAISKAKTVLSGRGVSEDELIDILKSSVKQADIDYALDYIGDIDYIEQTERRMLSCLSSNMSKARMYRSLGSTGFSTAVADEILKKWGGHDFSVECYNCLVKEIGYGVKWEYMLEKLGDFYWFTDEEIDKATERYIQENNGIPLDSDLIFKAIDSYNHGIESESMFIAHLTEYGYSATLITNALIIADIDFKANVFNYADGIASFGESYDEVFEHTMERFGFTSAEIEEILSKVPFESYIKARG